MLALKSVRSKTIRTSQFERRRYSSAPPRIVVCTLGALSPLAAVCPMVHFFRLLACFAISACASFKWWSQLRAWPTGTGDGEFAALGLAGLGSNLGMLFFGLLMLGMSVAGLTLRVSSWRLSMGLLVIFHFIGPSAAFWIAEVWAIVGYSAALTLVATVFTAQVTAGAIDGSDYSLARRGGSLGYGLAFVIASLGDPRWVDGLCLITAAALWLNQPRPQATPAAHLEDVPIEPFDPTKSGVDWAVVKTFLPLAVLFAGLAAAARVYDSFGPASLLGTREGIIGVSALIGLECILLPYTTKLRGLSWVLAALLAWIGAYALLWVGGWLQIVAVAFVGVNCCGQTVLQRRVQGLARPGSANFQAILIALGSLVAGTVSSLAVPWTREGATSIWLLGLSATFVVIAVAFPAVALVRLMPVQEDLSPAEPTSSLQ
jgi:hypothetical protein